MVKREENKGIDINPITTTIKASVFTEAVCFSQVCGVNPYNQNIIVPTSIIATKFAKNSINEEKTK